MLTIQSLTTPRDNLIRLAGFVGPTPASILIDCGASGNFLSEGFATSHGLALSTSDKLVKLADGLARPAAGTARAVRVRVGTYVDALDLTVTQLGGYDVILGMPWLIEHEPHVDWKGTFSTPDGKRAERR